MSNRITRFLKKVMCDISKAPESLFRRFYYEREITDINLDARIRSCAFSGNNIFLLGRTGEGKTCFLRNYQLNNKTLAVGYLNVTQKPIHYFTISFDEPQWNTQSIDSTMLSGIVNGLEKYFTKYDLFPDNYPHDETPARKYNEAISILNELDFATKPSQLLIFIDDIDHAPFSFQISFLNAIYPLFRSPGCVCVYAVRHPAFATAKRRTGGRLATAFVDFQTVTLRPMPLKQLVQYRIGKTVTDSDFLKTLEEPDLALDDLKVEYLLPTTVDNWIQQYCYGNIREMIKLLIEFYEYFEKLKNEGNQSLLIGRTKLLELAKPYLYDIYKNKTNSGFSLHYTILEMLRTQSAVNDDFYAAIKTTGFEKPDCDRAIDELFENDIIEESMLPDSYSKIQNAEITIPPSYVLTSKGTWLVAMSTWEQYCAIFTPPKKTLQRGGLIFERRILCEFLEFIKELLLKANNTQPIIKIKWKECFADFHKFAHIDIPRSGSPGLTGFDDKQLYHMLDKAFLIDKRLSDYPNTIAINRNSFIRECHKAAIFHLDSNPFVDSVAIGKIADKIIIGM